MNKYTNETNETKATKAATVKPNAMVDWFIRLIKGIVIGIGFILPGLSGGVFAVILGIYDKLIQFLSDIRKKFLQNIAFFFPVAIGMAIGIVIFSIFVEKAFGKYAAQFICLFVGFVVGTFPSLYKTAGKEGRSSKDLILFAVSTLFIFVLMMIGEKQLTAVPPSFPVWMGSGALIGLGVVVPGMSPSNFLIYCGLYDKMAIGIKDFDFGVIIPLIIGLVVCVLMFAKLAAYLFRRYYSEMYHFILGMVAGSSLAIFPTVVFPAFHTEQLAASGLSFFGSFLLCIAFLGVGVIISYLFSKVEEKYPREEIF